MASGGMNKCDEICTKECNRMFWCSECRVGYELETAKVGSQVWCASCEMLYIIVEIRGDYIEAIPTRDIIPWLVTKVTELVDKNG